MCKAYILRFACNHGLVMNIKLCNKAPCPVLQQSSEGYSRQPQSCWTCQNKRADSTTSSSSTASSTSPSCASSFDSISSVSSLSAFSTSTSESSLMTIKPTTSSSKNLTPKPSRPSLSPPKPSAFSACPYKSNKSTVIQPFKFACSYIHQPAPHYVGLPSWLPSNNDCPACQLDSARTLANLNIVKESKATWHLVQEQRIKDGRSAIDWAGPDAFRFYCEERKQEERECWYFATKWWVASLTKSRINVREEEGLGLMG